jgi:hypothetical protein
VTVLADQQATLTQGEDTLLFRARFAITRLTLTGLSGEFTTIPFKVRRAPLLPAPGGGEFFEASEVFLKFTQTIFGADILATAPQGVATLDIVYEVRTRRDV